MLYIYVYLFVIGGKVKYNNWNNEQYAYNFKYCYN